MPADSPGRAGRTGREGGVDLVELRASLRLMILTEPQEGRALSDVVAECLAAGATAVQLRDKTATSRELYAQGLRLEPLIRRRGALFIVNDRVDVALALRADGVHLGPGDLPIEAARRVAPELVVGYSTDDAAEGPRAAAAGASYLGVGALFGTVSKPGLEEEAIGTGRLTEVMEESGLPVVGIGGVTADNAAAVAATGAGVAVLGAVMRAAEPGNVVRRILASTPRS